MRKRILLGVQDTTEVLQFQTAARESDARKDAILRVALDAIVTMDHEGKFVEFNPAAEKIFGYRRAEVLGKPVADLIIPARLREQHHQGLTHYRATGEGPVLNRQIELPALRADGTEFPAELAIVVIPGTQPPMFTCFLRDITERKRAEDALRQSHADLRAQVEELSRFNRVAVGRETRMIELKKEINELCQLQGEPARYPLEFEWGKEDTDG